MRILIDTNVVIDYLLQRQGFEMAKTILELGLSDSNMEYALDLRWKDMEDALQYQVSL